MELCVELADKNYYPFSVSGEVSSPEKTPARPANCRFRHPCCHNNCLILAVLVVNADGL
ncbi:MAG: hypothetical protein HC913_06845 [Microscillaceae bacterium]|nr:hypothetical protein [Microscillaceae bacterium]